MNSTPPYSTIFLPVAIVKICKFALIVHKIYDCDDSDDQNQAKKLTIHNKNTYTARIYVNCDQLAVIFFQ